MARCLRDGRTAPPRRHQRFSVPSPGLPQQATAPNVWAQAATTRLNLLVAVCFVGVDESLTVTETV